MRLTGSASAVCSTFTEEAERHCKNEIMEVSSPWFYRLGA